MEFVKSAGTCVVVDVWAGGKAVCAVVVPALGKEAIAGEIGGGDEDVVLMFGDEI